MDAVFRALAIYFFLLVLIRLTGNRPLSQLTVFDLVLLIIIGESTQQALIGDNFSVTNAMVLIVTLIATEIFLSIAGQKWRWVKLVGEGVPVVVMHDGEVLKDRLKECGFDEADLMAAARSQRGLENMGQIKYAIVERDGSISVIAKHEK